jgi:hypothetical protein
VASASYAFTNFLGGEISQFAQGGFEKPSYKQSLNVCYNSFPVEIGAWTRRPGTIFAGTTLGGAAGRVISWSFEQTTPYTIEFTNGNIRFRQSAALVSNNDSVGISSISTANPAVLTTAAATTWATGATIMLANLGTSIPLLQNRQISITKLTTQTFSLQDSITGANIDGSTLSVSGLAATATAYSIQTLVSPFAGGIWATVRMVQAETTGLLLQGAVAPQALTVPVLPTGNVPATFALTAATFNDGPYLNPFTNGALVTPNQTTGIVQLTVSFPQWVPTTSYATGDFVTSNGINYESLIDQNIGNPITCAFQSSSASITATQTFAANNKVCFFANNNGSTAGVLPAALTQGTVYYVISTGLSGSAFEVSATQGGSAITMAGAGTGSLTVSLAPAQFPANWSAVNASAAINPPPGNPNGAGRGFLQTDIGRLVRLFSEPALWSTASSYSEGNVVSYNPTGDPGAATYWQSLTNTNVGNIPGSDATNWELVAPGAALPSIGTFTNPAAGAGPAQWTWGKITSLINFIAGNIAGVVQIGNMTSDGGLSAAFNGNTDQNAASSAAAINLIPGEYGYAGQNYSGCSPADFAIASVTIFPPSDNGLANVSWTSWNAYATVTAYLYGSNSLPSNGTNGTLLGSAVVGTLTPSSPDHTALGTSAITIASTDLTDTWAYVWIAYNLVVTSGTYSGIGINYYAAQIEFVNAAGTGASANGINVELLGPPLLYTTSIRTWRLGAYSNTTGWPACGCYADGRIWLASAIANRFDASYSNGVMGSEVNFAPTDQYGTVTNAHAISDTLNSDSINPIYWMVPDLQGILIGTQEREWLLFAPGQGGFAPDNIDSRPAGRHGCANVEPRPTEHTYVFVQRFNAKLMELFADVFSGKFTAPNLADKAQHITRNGIAEIVYTYASTPIIWGRDMLGNFFGCTYKRDTLMTSQGPTYYAWHRHGLGSGRIVNSITAGPSVGGNLDALTMVTNETNASDPQYNVNHVEILTDQPDELTPLGSAWYLDDAVNPSSTVSSGTPVTGAPYGGLTLNGLWHLNGETVAVFAGGLDCGNYTVSNGSVFVPYGDSVSAGTGAGLFTAAFAASGISIVVGFDYLSQGQLVRPQLPADAGTRSGPALGKKRRFQQAAFQLVNAAANASGANQLALSIGRNFAKLFPMIIGYTSTSDAAGGIVAGQTFTGIFRDSSAGTSDYDGMLCWQVNRGMPADIVAVEPMLHGED